MHIYTAKWSRGKTFPSKDYVLDISSNNYFIKCLKYKRDYDKNKAVT